MVLLLKQLERDYVCGVKNLLFIQDPFITLILPWGFDFGGSIFHVSFLFVVSLEDHNKHQVQLVTLYIREFA